MSLNVPIGINKLCNNTHMVARSPNNAVLLYHGDIFALCSIVCDWHLSYDLGTNTSPILGSRAFLGVGLCGDLIYPFRGRLPLGLWFGPFRGVSEIMHHVSPSVICDYHFFFRGLVSIKIEVTHDNRPVPDLVLSALEQIESHFHLLFSILRHV